MKKKLKVGDIVRLKNGEIVEVTLVLEPLKNVQSLVSKPETYEVLTESGTKKDITIDDVIEVLTLLQRLWIIISNFFKK